MKPASLTNAKSPALRTGRLYTAILVGVTVFLVALMFARNREGHWVAEARLFQHGASPTETTDSLSQIIEGLTSPTLATHALAAHDPKDRVRLNDPHRTEALLRHLRVKPMTSLAAGQTGVIVQLQGQSKIRTRELLETLCNQFIKERSTPAADYRSPLAIAQQKIGDAESRLETLEQDLQQVDDQLATLAVAAIEPTEAAPAEALISDIEATQDPPEQELASEAPDLPQHITALIALELKRQQLTGEVSESHPALQALSDQIAAKRAEVDQLRAGIATVSDTNTVTDEQQQEVIIADNQATQEAAAEAAAQRDFEASLLTQQQSLELEIASAGKSHADLVTSYEALERDHAQQQTSASWHLTIPANVRRQYRATSLAAVTVAGLFALGAAALFVVFSRAVTTLGSAAQAQQQLGVAAWGPVNVVAAALDPQQRTQGVRLLRIRTGCEVALVLIVVSALVVAGMDANFANYLRSDPLSALADGIVYLPQTFLN